MLSVGSVGSVGSVARCAPHPSRSVYVGNLPFALPCAQAAADLCATLRLHSGALGNTLLRVAVSDFTAQGVAEFEHEPLSGSRVLRLLSPPHVGADTPAARKPRDAGKHNRGFAVLCFASASAAAAATAALTSSTPCGALAGTTLRLGDSGATRRLYLREELWSRSKELAEAAAAKDSRRAARAPHRARQRERDRAAREAALTAALRAAADADGDVAAVWQLRAFSAWTSPSESKQAGALDWDQMPAAVDPCRGGGLDFTPRGHRKRLQVESFLAVLRTLLPNKRAVIADFGAGTGNLCVPLAWALPQCRFYAVDCKRESVERLSARASAAGLENLSAVQGRIEQFPHSFDIALGLHVCGAGTDAALEAATSRRAAFCVSPCCVGKLNLQGGGGGGGAQSRLISRRLRPEDYALLASAADYAGDSHTSGYDTASQRGALPRAAKACVETDRAARAQEHGYRVHLVKLLHPEACVRNDLLIGWPTDLPGADALFTPPSAPLRDHVDSSSRG